MRAFHRGNERFGAEVDARHASQEASAAYMDTPKARERMYIRKRALTHPSLASATRTSPLEI